MGLSQTFPNNKYQLSQKRVPVVQAVLLGWPTLESRSRRRWQKPRVAFRIRAPCLCPSAFCSPGRRSLRSWEDTRSRSSGTSAGTERRGNLEAKAGSRTWGNTGIPVYVHPWDPWQYPCCTPASWVLFLTQCKTNFVAGAQPPKQSLPPRRKLTTPVDSSVSDL